METLAVTEELLRNVLASCWFSHSPVIFVKEAFIPVCQEQMSLLVDRVLTMMALVLYEKTTGPSSRIGLGF